MADNEMMTGYLAGKNDAGNGGFGCGMIPWMMGMGAGMGFGGMGWGGYGGMIGEWIPLLFLAGIFGWGNNGFGGGGRGDYATQADLAAGFNNSAVLNNLNDLTLGQAGIQQTLCQGFGGINTAIGNLGYNIQAGINGISREIGDCCCTTQRAIDGVNYNMATQFCNLGNTIQSGFRDVIEGQNAGTRAILDFLTQDKIATLTAENQSLKFAASQASQNAFITANQEAQTAELIRRLGRDCPVPAYVVPNPNCCYGNPVGIGYGNGGGCGCGCG